MLASRNPRPPARRGAILLVVITLLALFAVVGLSFALYGQAEATAARIQREAQDDPDPFTSPDAQSFQQTFVNQFLAQLVYGVKDTGQDTTSALRGHEL